MCSKGDSEEPGFVKASMAKRLTKTRHDQHRWSAKLQNGYWNFHLKALPPNPVGPKIKNTTNCAWVFKMDGFVSQKTMCVSFKSMMNGYEQVYPYNIYLEYLWGHCDIVYMCISCASQICISTIIYRGVSSQHLILYRLWVCWTLEIHQTCTEKNTYNLWTGLWMQRSANAELVLCLLTFSKGWWWWGWGWVGIPIRDRFKGWVNAQSP